TRRERGAAARMEVRLGDATANPYLAMAAVGAAVYLGITGKVEPPAKLEGYGYDPSRAEVLPQRLADALDALEADRELAEVLGEYFVGSFLAYKRNAGERFERFVLDWQFREYAYHLKGAPPARAGSRPGPRAQVGELGARRPPGPQHERGREPDDQQCEGEPRSPDRRAGDLVERAEDRGRGDEDADYRGHDDADPARRRREAAQRADRHQQVHHDQGETAERGPPGEQREVVRGARQREQAGPELVDQQGCDRGRDHEGRRAQRRAVAPGGDGERRGEPAVAGHGEGATGRRHGAPDGDREHVEQHHEFQQPVDPGAAVPACLSGSPECEKRRRGGGGDRLEVVVETGPLHVRGEHVEDRGDARRGQHRDRNLAARAGRLLGQVRRGLEPDEHQHPVQHAEEDPGPAVRRRRRLEWLDAVRGAQLHDDADEEDRD